MTSILLDRCAGKTNSGELVACRGDVGHIRGRRLTRFWILVGVVLATGVYPPDSESQEAASPRHGASEPAAASEQPPDGEATQAMASGELSVLDIIRRIDQTERVAASEGEFRQVITTSGGRERTLEMRAYSRDRNDKQLLEYTAPRRVKGDKILMLDEGNDIWFYTPKTDRVRHLASHARRQKVQGSDFAYEDMAGGSLEDDYTCALLGSERVEQNPCYKLELIPTQTGPHYSRLILWADRERFVTRRIDYFEEGDLLKRLMTHDVCQIDGHWYAMRMEMTDLQEGGQTTMETLSIRFDMELPDALFTTTSLKRRSR